MYPSALNRNVIGESFLGLSNLVLLILRNAWSLIRAIGTANAVANWIPWPSLVAKKDEKSPRKTLIKVGC